MTRDQELRRRLVIFMKDVGALRSEPWCRAFLAVPRHSFIPRFLALPPGAETDVEFDGTLADQRESWIETAYRDVAAVTRTDERGRYTSSSSMPSVMAKMLEWLRVEDGNTVLEIGTGTGYNAALLCERLGSRAVTSIDIEGDLVEEARERLHALGYTPHLAVANGATGYPGQAPYDRLICTCSAWPAPVSWIGQMKPGGVIVTVVPDGCVRLDIQADGSASGRFHTGYFGFMRMRSYMPGDPDLVEVIRRSCNPEGAVRPYKHLTGILRAGGTDQRSFATLVSALVAPNGLAFSNDDGESIFFDGGDYSWGRLDWRTGRVFQGGRRRIWDQVENLYEQWCELGAPNRERFGLTVRPDGSHVLWLDSPESEHRWEVNPTRIGE